MRKKLQILITAICMVAVATIAYVWADDSLVTASGNTVEAGSGLSFKINLSAIPEEIETYTINVSVSPNPEKVTVSNDVNVTANYVNGTYAVTSADVADVKALNFTVYPGSDITESTEYTVTVNVISEVDTQSVSFNFTAQPKQTDNPNGKNGQTGNQPTAQMKGKAAASIKGGVSVSGGSGSTSTTDSTLVYSGSSDNYLDSLSVDGYKFTNKFNKTRETYFLSVNSDVTSLDVSATASDSSADVSITGADNISGDRSKIQINVTADDGSVRVYRIYVTRSGKEQ